MAVAAFHGGPSDIGDLEHRVAHLHSSPDTPRNVHVDVYIIVSVETGTTDHVVGSLGLIGVVLCGEVMLEWGRRWERL